ncbi:uracil-DNA glycosylase [Chitinimonas sp. JJ19]|uniref:uracil-DNA glycosylase n=1 Tax=Chitinimonas sp. JJ19 TaxID=3109352 RepID=UPI002FFFB9BE
MSDGRRELILEELGLAPCWVRRELLTADPAPVELTPVITAPPPSAAIDAAMETVAAPTQAAGGRPSRMAQVMPAEKPAEVPAAQPAALVTSPDHRALAIAQLDWPALQAEVAACTACSLCKSRSKTVFGVGKPDADWLVVGEAPGAEEDRQGEPFVGQAGKLLDAMLASVDRSRQENVFILNTLKCRPPQNRNPHPDELALCAPFLHRQVELIKPKVIFAVGRFAVQTLLGREASIASLRGKLHDYRGTPVVVSYHPAYLLRNMPDKYKAWQDLLMANKTLEKHKD